MSEQRVCVVRIQALAERNNVWRLRFCVESQKNVTDTFESQVIRMCKPACDLRGINAKTLCNLAFCSAMHLRFLSKEVGEGGKNPIYEATTVIINVALTKSFNL
ncbi:MAG: hypothetical protein CVT73_05430 [Alphaproteobacteria bacterium HGW-Alphaproteobacteria-12]|nr:MAG: hypothetical protein CVT73_05430 [Alphaproteobacteria bacterium HGW-Alphaproteobacteria-12]